MMHLNTDALVPARKPCLRDLATLTATLLPPALVMLVPESELERRCREIDATHPHFRKETPVVLRPERHRRHRLSGQLHVAGRAATHAYGCRCPAAACMSELFDTLVSLTNARTVKRLRSLPAGAALVPAPQSILTPTSAGT